MERNKTTKGPNTCSSALVCPLPVAFDVYYGCSHKCAYCFANRRKGLKSKRSDSQSEVKLFGSPKQLEDWCKGNRTKEESWCDWNIPIKFGVNSDAFQPCEIREGVALKCLKIFAKYRYPFVIITKGTSVITRPEYLAVLKDCNCVVNVSMCCSLHDKIETGAPKYEERLRALSILSKTVKRTIARWQPFFYEFMPVALKEVNRVKSAGAYAVLVEGAYLDKPSKNHTDFWGGKYRYPYSIIERYTHTIRAKCHAEGIKFLTSEIRRMSDDLTCCGTEGVEGFRQCTCNGAYKILRPEEYHATPAMKRKGSCSAIWNWMRGNHSYSDHDKFSFEDVVKYYSWLPETRDMFLKRC